MTSTCYITLSRSKISIVHMIRVSLWEQKGKENWFLNRRTKCWNFFGSQKLKLSLPINYQAFCLAMSSSSYLCLFTSTVCCNKLESNESAFISIWLSKYIRCCLSLNYFSSYLEWSNLGYFRLFQSSLKKIKFFCENLL